MTEERDAALQQYYKENGGLPEEEKKTEEVQTPEITPTVQPPVEAEKTELPAEKTEESVKTEEELRKEQEKEHNLKKALDEERAKRKRINEEKSILEAKLKEYETRQEPPKDPEPITDYDAELNAVKSKIRSFELMEARREELARQDAIRQGEEKLRSMVDSVHKELKDEGFAGFKRMAGEVTAELMALAQTDPEEARNLDNPEGWKKIFKEKIYPEFQKEFAETVKVKTLEDKKTLKKDANLNTSSGKAPVKSKDDDPDTWSPERRQEEYMKLRQAKVR